MQRTSNPCDVPLALTGYKSDPKTLKKMGDMEIHNMQIIIYLSD
jgi:hypothetical protein